MPHFEYNTEPLDEMEDVLGVFYGGRGQVGQQIIVTNRRLLIGPIDTGIALKIDTYILNKIGGPGDLVKDVLNSYAPMQPTTIWLRHVVSVQATNNASLFKAPGLRITTDTAEQIEIRVVATQTTPNLSSKNNPVRDRAVEIIRTAVNAAKAAPPRR
jgi:hypothetical protein